VRAPCDFSGLGEKSLRRLLSSGVSGVRPGEHFPLEPGRTPKPARPPARHLAAPPLHPHYSQFASSNSTRPWAGRIPQHFIDELIARTDIIEVIGSRVQLKRAGREYKACCPFHDEKTPSFTVSPDKQFYHCFGCGAHGTALGFVMEYDHASFVEAVEDLAARAAWKCRARAARRRSSSRTTSCTWRSSAPRCSFASRFR